MTDRPVPWNRVYHYLHDLADAKLTAADYGMAVRKLHDVLVEESDDAEAVREFLLLFHTSELYHRGRLSRQHRALVVKLLPKPPRQKRGRPKGALSDKANDKRYQLYMDWIGEKTLNPYLTGEQFAKQRLDITEAQYDADFDLDDPDADGPLHKKVKALLQDLKPARMKQLHEGQRRALEIIYPLLITWDREFARQWREAKQRSPRLTKEKFIENFFKWPRKRKQHPIEAEMIREFLERLDIGEKQLADSERVSDRDQSARPATANSKRKPAR